MKFKTLPLKHSLLGILLAGMIICGASQCMAQGIDYTATTECKLHAHTWREYEDRTGKIHFCTNVSKVKIREIILKPLIISIHINSGIASTSVHFN